MSKGEADHNQVGPHEPSDYELKIDSQVEKFLELKHQLTFFLITAAIGSIGYTLNFSVARLQDVAGHPARIVCLVVGCFLGLLAAGAALSALHQEIVSYQLHLKNRYARRTWDQLPPTEQKHWNRVNQWANVFQKTSFFFLILSITFQSALFLLFLL